MTVHFEEGTAAELAAREAVKAPVSGELGETLSLKEVARRGGRIIRVRVLTEYRPGYGKMADISYIKAEVNGVVHHVYLDLATSGILRNLKGEFIAWAKENGVYAKALGLLDDANWSVQ